MTDNQVALVTGASRGIGREIALALAKGGFTIAVNYVSNAAAAETLVAELQSGGVDAVAFCADVSNFELAGQLVASTIERFGRLDVLVNNAGITRDNLLMRMSENDWDQVLAVNLKGYFNCSRAVVRSMLQARRGRIINISSVVGIRGNAGQANYAAAKAGVSGLTKSMARELGSRGITVNAVAPGFIDTDMTRALPAGIREKLLDEIPLRRLGTGTDVAALVSFLAGPGAEYITGQVIAVDGGMAM